MKTKALSLALALVMCLGLSIPALADSVPYTYQNDRYHVTNVLEDTLGVDLFHPEDGGAWPLLTCAAPVKISVTAEYALVEYGKDNGYMEGDRTSLNGSETEIALTEPGFYYVDFFWAGEDAYYDQCQIEIKEGTGAPSEAQPAIPASGTAVASTQTVTVDGKAVEFQMYALLDEKGNGTNYIKLRDMAYILNGTEAQFSVGYDNTSKSISVRTGEAYQAGGSEMTTPYSGDRAYTGGIQSIQVNGSAVDMTAITLLDDAGGGYNYFKLRDLGAALGFNVGWSGSQGVFIESDKPYTE